MNRFNILLGICMIVESRTYENILRLTALNWCRQIKSALACYIIKLTKIMFDIVIDVFNHVLL